jgi:hypothetical protein
MIQATATKVILDEARKQGFALFLLCVAVWYFYTEKGRNEERMEHMQQRIDKCTQDQITTLTNVVENNTGAFENLGKIVEIMIKEQKKYHEANK